MTSVAWPRIFGPITESATLMTPRATTSTTSARSGASMPTSRRADGPKSIDFSAGIPADAHGGPPPRRAADISRAARPVSSPPPPAGAGAGVGLGLVIPLPPR
ncbi:hypothetical protein [Pseudonocardia alaniniphila]|uniref:hypothetical protein n=1 Tax=Pseudonocardia alaniniphila TaxID=75291 RepID=UPI00363C977C